jgi:hypothetical protein
MTSSRAGLSLLLSGLLVAAPVSALAQGSIAAPPAQQSETAPLAAAGAAGVEQAQAIGNIRMEFIILGALALAALILILATDDGDDISAPATTGT